VRWTANVSNHARSRRGPGSSQALGRTRIYTVVLFFELLLVAAVVVITWFALYALYRLITDES